MLITEYASTRMLSAVMPPLTCSGDANSVRTASAPSPVRPNRATMPSAKAESPGRRSRRECRRDESNEHLGRQRQCAVERAKLGEELQHAAHVVRTSWITYPRAVAVVVQTG